jgi:hypothetical protein
MWVTDNWVFSSPRKWKPKLFPIILLMFLQSDGRRNHWRSQKISRNVRVVKFFFSKIDPRIMPSKFDPLVENFQLINVIYDLIGTKNKIRQIFPSRNGSFCFCFFSLIRRDQFTRRFSICWHQRKIMVRFSYSQIVEFKLADLN